MMCDYKRHCGRQPIGAAVVATRNNGVTEPMCPRTDGYDGAVRRPAWTD